MSVVEIRQKEEYDGKEFLLYRITNALGSYIEVLNYGASIVSVVVPSKSGKMDNIVLRYDNLLQYLEDDFYLGATIGRYANRISNAKFELDNVAYRMDRNDNANSNHGGFEGFNSKFFDSRIEDDKVVFSTKSDGGEGGFPGELIFSAIYSFSENNRLRIEYTSESTKKTPVNFTNHAYFNLLGTKSSALNHYLKVNAEECLEMDYDFLPTGNSLLLQNSDFDFREFKKIGVMAEKKHDNLGGYNAYYIRAAKKDDMAIAFLQDDISGRRLEVYSSMPGVQFYTGDFLSKDFIPFQGVCLEAQYYPDAINKQGFEQCILEPNTKTRDWIEYVFFTFC